MRSRRGGSAHDGLVSRVAFSLVGVVLLARFSPSEDADRFVKPPLDAISPSLEAHLCEHNFKEFVVGAQQTV